MTKIKAILIVSFVVTFAAGAAVGMLVARLDLRPHGPSWLEAELNLTSRQREQMHNIWSEVMGSVMRQRFEQGRALRQERDQAIAALMTDEQRPRYEAILNEYARKDGELSEQRKQAFDEAVRRTKEILTAEQAAKYEELMKRQPDRGFGPPRGGRRGPPPGSPPGPPAGQPPDNPNAPRGGE
jgi:Spy/CpxP family protein refolding chaperone